MYVYLMLTFQMLIVCQGRARVQKRRPKYLTLQMLQIQGSEDISKELSLYCATESSLHGKLWHVQKLTTQDLFIFPFNLLRNITKENIINFSSESLPEANVIDLLLTFFLNPYNQTSALSK